MRTTSSSRPDRRFSGRLDRAFYARPAIAVAPDLIGATLVRRWRGRVYRARLVEIEAYLGPRDLAAHASKGLTGRTQVLFGPAGRAYVYFIYGLHEMLNIVTGNTGDAESVLVRAAEPLDGWIADLSGPGKLTRALHISRAQNALDVTGDALHLLAAPRPGPRIVRTARIGVDYAQQWKDLPLRFLDADSAAVSRKWRDGGDSQLQVPRM
ncbi:MAG TPA: DNA-3-methyladenine glycosylase [Tepidisphaeraceae bacterium]|nr:DNA-3-methyladenine glycosylase [Tepidisphaeraceae bacterium]